jgi:chromosomal replication initiation ATPase DnaA
MEAILEQPVDSNQISPYAVPGVNVFTPQDLIESIVCDIYCLTPSQIRSHTRKREIVEARQICMALYYHLYKVKGKTLEDAARPYGKDHATALHAINTIKSVIKTQPRDRLTINYKTTFYRFAEFGTIKNQLTHYELL